MIDSSHEAPQKVKKWDRLAQYKTLDITPVHQLPLLSLSELGKL